MNNFLTNDTKAILLLCGVLGKDRTVVPLSQSEYSSLASWLVRERLRPESLLNADLIGEAAAGAKIERNRLEKLLDRGVQLGFAIEEWQRNGLWVISRSDPEYPSRYKTHLKEKAPPLLFGAGNMALLRGGGLAIVGSRNVDSEGEGFTRQIAQECARNGIPVVSGGARGVDQIAMRAVLESGGRTIGVLAENLLKSSIERYARYAIAEGQMLLISPYHPQARFTVGTAMGRNKLIYAMADFGLVVSAEHKKGGTWAGAEEELKREKPIGVFVRISEKVPEGNRELLKLGALEWPSIIRHDEMNQQLTELAKGLPRSLKFEDRSEPLSLFDYHPQPDLGEKKTEEKQTSRPLQQEKKVVEVPEVTAPCSIYEAVLPIIFAHLKEPTKVDDLAARLDIAKGQLNVWLKRAVDDGLVRKHKNPVRFSIKRGT